MFQGMTRKSDITTAINHLFVVLVIILQNKKLSYHRGTARHAMLVNLCCFTRYGSYKGYDCSKFLKTAHVTLTTPIREVVLSSQD